MQSSLTIIRFLYVVVSLVVFSGQAHAQSSSCKTKEDLRVSVGALWETRTNENQKILIDCIRQAWNYQYPDKPQRDRVQESGFQDLASGLMTSALQFNPENFFRLMDGRPALLSRWLSGVQWEAFTWYGDPPCALQDQIDSIDLLLRYERPVLKRYKSYIIVRNKLRSVKCSQVH